MQRYLIITSDVPEKVIRYLNRLKIGFKTFSFNHVINLSNVDFHDRENGMTCWKECDNFIEGLEWEDYRIKPRTPEEAQRGFLSPDKSCNRGWQKYRCKAYRGKERILGFEKNGEKITDNNPRGVIEGPSCIVCDHCEDYSPKTLSGRREVLIQIKKQYEEELKKIMWGINYLESELQKQSPDSLDTRVNQ